MLQCQRKTGSVYLRCCRFIGPGLTAVMESERQAIETALGSYIGANTNAQLQTNISSIAESSAAHVIMAGSAPAPAPSFPGTVVTLHGSSELLINNSLTAQKAVQ